jgi:hypothetical protein
MQAQVLNNISLVPNLNNNPPSSSVVHLNPYKNPYKNDYPTVWDKETIDKVNNLYKLRHNRTNENNVEKQSELYKILFTETMTFFTDRYMFYKRSYFEDRHDLYMLLYDLLQWEPKNLKKFGRLGNPELIIDFFREQKQTMGNYKKNENGISIEKNIVSNFSNWSKMGYIIYILNKKYKKNQIRSLQFSSIFKFFKYIVYDNKEEIMLCEFDKDIRQDRKYSCLFSTDEIPPAQEDKDLLKREQDLLQIEEALKNLRNEENKFEILKNSIINRENQLAKNEKIFANKDNRLVEIEKTLFTLEKELNIEKENFKVELANFEIMKKNVQDQENRQVERRLVIIHKEKELAQKEKEFEGKTKKIKADDDTIDLVLDIIKELAQEISFIGHWSKEKQRKIGKLQMFLKLQT